VPQVPFLYHMQMYAFTIMSLFVIR
jgi:hypothetical protein